MTNEQLDVRLDQWAKWVWRGGCAGGGLGYGGSTLINLTSGNSDSHSHGMDDLEVEVERAVGCLHQYDARAAKVLRIEYGADLRINPADHDFNQEKIAKRMGMSRSSYCKALKIAKLAMFMALDGGFGVVGSRFNKEIDKEVA